jgi:tetratricopeptide (TPR) repeat protein
MKTITFYSYKGGVGRTLALSNIAIRLSELKKKVCLLDFDLEAPGLPFKFKNYKPRNAIQKGIVDYISHSIYTQNRSEPIKEYSIVLDAPNANFTDITLIPAGNIEEDQYWKTLSSIKWAELFYSEDAEGVNLILNLKAKIEKELDPDVLLIDSRTGITDIAGITLRLLADEVVILASCNDENLFGSKKILKILLDKEKSLFGVVPKVTFLLTRLPFTDHQNDKMKELQIIDRIKNEFKDIMELPDLSVIHSDRRLEENESLLIGYEYEAKGVSISNDYLRIFDKLTADVLSPNEVALFQNRKKAEKEFNKAMVEKDINKKMEYLSNAINLNPLDFNYYNVRASFFFQMKNYDSAIRDYKEAIKLNPSDAAIYRNLSVSYLYAKLDNNLDFAEDAIKKAIEFAPNDSDNYHVYGSILKRINKPEEAIKQYDNALNIDGRDDSVLNNKADSLRRIGRMKDAYELIHKAIDINPKNGCYFATLAEIFAAEGKMEEFYFNFNIACSLGLTEENMATAKDIYVKFQKDQRFLDIFARYNLDIDEVVGPEN